MRTPLPQRLTDPAGRPLEYKQRSTFVRTLCTHVFRDRYRSFLDVPVSFPPHSYGGCPDLDLQTPAPFRSCSGQRAGATVAQVFSSVSRSAVHTRSRASAQTRGSIACRRWKGFNGAGLYRLPFRRYICQETILGGQMGLGDSGHGLKGSLRVGRRPGNHLEIPGHLHDASAGWKTLGCSRRPLRRAPPPGN